MTVCRLLPYTVADGPNNMAADEVLLEAAGAGEASLRLYGWREATVSLGYFQQERLRREPRLAALPFVRRPSGGAALVHDRELTYALGLPAGTPWQGEGSWLVRMHSLIAQALAELGVPARACGEENREAFAGLLCFQHFTPGDLLLGPGKVVGSAQRRHRGALVQHGGILLAASPHAPELPGIAEITGRCLGPEEVGHAVLRHFARATGWELDPADWTSAERERIEELAATKYSQGSWNCKR